MPDSDVIMLHHAVWLNLSAPDSTTPSFPERFFAVGEEKTALTLPTGFGYRYEPTDQWILNYMLHVLVNQSFDVKVTYDLDFVPATAGKLRSVRPLWMDVQNGSGYPVFDALAGTGVAGRYTYPSMAVNPYGSGPAKNEYTVPAGGVIVQTAGHLHSGGLSTELLVDSQRCHRAQDQADLQVRRGLLRAGRSRLVGRVDDRDAGNVEGARADGRQAQHPGDVRHRRLLLVRVDGHHGGVVRARTGR